MRRTSNSLSIFSPSTTGFARSMLIPAVALATVLLALFTVGVKAVSAQERMIVLDDATVGKAYSEPLIAGGGGATAPFTWTLVAGSYPPGVQPDSASGSLLGTPTAAGTFNFTVRVTDSSAPARQDMQTYALRVLPAPAPPVPSPLIDRTGKKAVTINYVLPTSTADEETIALTEQFAYTPSFPTPNPDKDILYAGTIKSLIASSIGTDRRNFQPDDYCVVHLIKWKNQNGEGKTDPGREIWALFKSREGEAGNLVWEEIPDPQRKDLFRTRIFGQKRVVVLLISLNTPPTWDIKYKVTINKKTPTPIQNALSLLSVISGAALAADGGQPPRNKDIWGARMMLVKYTSSELIVKVNSVTADDQGTPVEQAKEYTNTYINERKYRWDVSVGIPVQTIKELQFTSDPNNGNRVTTSAKERQSVYGFLNIYPMPVDLKGDDFLTKPHFLFGVPLASKPLQRPIAGIGTGIFKAPIKFNIFAGVVFIRERVPRSLNVGDVAPASTLESDLRTRWVRKFTFGINFPISQIKNVIKTQ